MHSCIIIRVHSIFLRVQPLISPNSHLGKMNCSTQSSKPFPNFYCPSVKFERPCINFLRFRQNALHSTYLYFRLKNSMKLELQQRLLPVYASKRLLPVYASHTNPSEGSGDVKNEEAGQDPPFLTILAGFLVFFAICWMIGSIVMWLIGLFFHALSK